MRLLFQSTKRKLIDEGGLKELFEHVKNLLMATLVMAAGSYGIKQAAVLEVFGVFDVGFSGYVVLAIGVLLAVLNAINGFHKLNKQQWHVGFRVAAIFIYFVVTMRLVQLVVMLRSS